MLLCKQKINDITVIFKNGTYRTIPARSVHFFSIEKYFFNDFLPIFNLKCMVDYDLYKKINELECTFSINISKFYVPSKNTSYDKRYVMFSNFIKDIFKNTNTGDTTPDMYQNITNRTQNNNLDKPNEFQKEQLELELFLFQLDSLNYTTLNNNVFSDTDIFGTILGLATVTNQRNMLISYPKNESNYSNIVIPNNLTFIGCIEFLQAVYGIYNKSYCLFNDFDALYLIDKDINCNAYRKNEYKRVYINYSDKTSSIGNINGQFKDDTYKCYRINSTSAPINLSGNDTNNNILGTQINTVNTINNSVTKNSITDVKILDNKYNNNFAIESYQYEKSMNNIITADFKEIDLEILKLNREYYFSFDIQNDSGNYNNAEGLYKILSIQAIYEKKDDDIFENTIRTKFIRA